MLLRLASLQSCNTTTLLYRSRTSPTLFDRRNFPNTTLKYSTHLTNMFQRALQQKQTHPPSKLPPPKPKPATQPSIQDAFPGRFAPPKQRTQDVLKPAPNKNPPYRPPGVPPSFSTSRKRSLDEREGLAKALNNCSGFQENVPPNLIEEEASPPNSKAALMDAVYFDENDFDDDLELEDFDVTDSTIDPALAAAAAAIPSPRSRLRQLDDIETDPFPIELVPHFPTGANNSTVPPQSSAPLPWSSSPVEHRISSSTLRGQEKRQSPQEPPTSSGVSSDAPTKRRRTLPWAKEETSLREKAISEEAMKEEEAMRKEKEIAMKGRASTNKSKASSTEPKVKRERKGREDRSFPWNETPKGMKAAQKDMRKRNGQKRSITTAADEAVVAAKAKELKDQVSPVYYTEEQRMVMDLVVQKEESVFFTGSAGTGKSVLLREIIAALKKKYRRDSDRVCVTASTGLAACNIGGITIHSYAGIGLGKESVQDLVRKVRRNAKTKARWQRTKFLIIDEVSMVDADLFDKLEGIARQIRGNGRPFGGIKLVVTGDFFQLPPVPDNGKLAKFAFDAETWNTCIGHTIGLSQVFRQRDEEFARMLNEMRLGHLSKETIDTFRKLSRPLPTTDGIQPTELFSTRVEVERANNTRMRQLPGESWTFNAEDSGAIQDKQYRDKLLSNCMAPSSIELKEGAQVMLIKNYDETLVNGSLGKVVGFMNEKTWDTACEDGDLGSLINTPDERIRSLKMGDKKIDTARRWPLVQFQMVDGTTREMLCAPEQWKIEQPNGEVSAQRSQVPLILAWALSIHKAQGQTLEKVKVDLGKAFEKGQAYVALSRATTKEGLQVLGFNPAKVMAHEKVRKFYESLYNHSKSGTSSGSNSRSVTPMNSTTASRSTVTRKTVPASKAASNQQDEYGDLDFPDDEETQELMRHHAF